MQGAGWDLHSHQQWGTTAGNNFSPFSSRRQRKHQRKASSRFEINKRLYFLELHRTAQLKLLCRPEYHSVLKGIPHIREKHPSGVIKIACIYTKTTLLLGNSLNRGRQRGFTAVQCMLCLWHHPRATLLYVLHQSTIHLQSKSELVIMKRETKPNNKEQVEKRPPVNKEKNRLSECYFGNQPCSFLITQVDYEIIQRQNIKRPSHRWC